MLEKNDINKDSNNSECVELVKVGEFIDKFENGDIINSLKNWNKECCETIENYQKKRKNLKKIKNVVSALKMMRQKKNL